MAPARRAAWLLAALAGGGGPPEYLRLGRPLLTLHAFTDDGVVPAAVRPPLYPAVIAFGELITGRPLAAILVLQVLLGVATVALTFAIADRCFNRRTALIAGCMLAVAPMTSRYSTV